MEFFSRLFRKKEMKEIPELPEVEGSKRIFTVNKENLTEERSQAVREELAKSSDFPIYGGVARAVHDPKESRRRIS